MRVLSHPRAERLNVGRLRRTVPKPNGAAEGVRAVKLVTERVETKHGLGKAVVSDITLMMQ